MSLCPSCNADAGDVARFCPSCGATILRMAGASDDYTGKIIAGKFRVEKLLGEGGMGKVYKATQLSLDKTVVLKVLRQTLLSDSRTVARFQREAKAASRLNHPNSIGVIDFGQGEDGAMYIAMEFVSGQDLHQMLSAEGPLPESKIVRIVGQVLSALTEAHGAGVIHRDLKPENIMVEQRRGEPNFVKVLDFGIAKIQDSEGGSEGQALTRAGFVCGTPEYMSPEQARGSTLDQRSDLYAVGVIMYQCATNQLPFESDSAVGFATKHLTEEPMPPRRKRPDAFISDAMEALILRALAKDPNDRPQTADEFRSELLAIVESGEDRTSVSPMRPAPIPLRNTGKHKAAAAPDDGGRTPSWASNPGAAPARAAPARHEDASDDTRTSMAPSEDAKKKAPLALIGGGLAAVAALGVGAFILLKPAETGPKKDPLALVMEPHTRSDPSSKDPEPRPDPSVATVKDPDKARALSQKGEDALATRNFDEALLYFRQAHDSDPTLANKKRVALAYLMKSDPVSASRWLKDYAAEAKTPDVAYVERFLEASKRPEEQE